MVVLNLHLKVMRKRREHASALKERGMPVCIDFGKKIGYRMLLRTSDDLPAPPAMFRTLRTLRTGYFKRLLGHQT